MKSAVEESSSSRSGIYDSFSQNRVGNLVTISLIPLLLCRGLRAAAPPLQPESLETAAQTGDPALRTTGQSSLAESGPQQRSGFVYSVQGLDVGPSPCWLPRPTLISFPKALPVFSRVIHGSKA